MILSISINNLQSWALERELIQHKFKLVYAQYSWHFLSLPFFYTFLIHYLGIEKKSFNLLRIAFPIFFALCIFQTGFVLYIKDMYDRTTIDHLYEKYSSFEEFFSLIVSLIVFTYSFYIIYIRKELFKKILSYDNLKWIYAFFILLPIGYLLWLGALIIKFKLNFSGFIFSYYPLRIYTTIVIYWLGYQGIKHLRILKERKQIRQDFIPSTISNSNTFYLEETPALSKKDKEKDAQFISIEKFITQEKKYLEPKYSLLNLSNDVNLSTSTLSALINTNANKSFSDFINEMRVEHAKKLLIDPRFSNYTITSIGLESGFNSKSAFYDVFKKQIGTTPLAYKNQNHQ
ncbi:helix-turn-helix domain-containing protein [Tenacibaculum sp. IB213877]|uniref:helix-turn-helix domain-containing protein n=1 Tax=Tenacibaculum sp. IB213877 TaxID=3097351 RepID=UPI002A5AB519|nr:helix-turn-helix domain-containing protein [Tenacibaculum sp. IB213877]MDY0781157.1 helix-turn-helix domain-containing protein [Tenacibaculum sp. IB213877]